MTKVLTKRVKRRLFSLFIALVLATVGYATTKPTPPPEVLGTVAPGYYRVVSVADGDTVVIEMDGRQEHIRLIGVDTPETKDPRKPVQCFGQAASDYTKQLIGNQNVRLESDPLSTNRDRYNRLLRYVYVPDGKLVQAEIIKNGYGFAYTSFPFTKADEFRAHEKLARDQNKGLWGSCPTTPRGNDYTSGTQ